MKSISKALEAKIAEAREEGLAFFWASLHVGGAVQFVGYSWEDGGVSVGEDGSPAIDSRGNTVAGFRVEELDPSNSVHVAQCEEWWG